MTWFEVLVKVVDGADSVLDKVRKTPRKRLAVVPQPNAPPDPFSAPPREAAPSAEPAIGDPKLAAQIFGKRTDPVSGRVVQLFREKGVDAKFTNLEDPAHELLEKQLVRETKQYELPYVYLRGVFLGGFEQVTELVREGKLESRCAE